MEQPERMLANMIFEYNPEKGIINERLTPLVSIVMTSYNQPELSLKSLKSLLSQDYQNLEIIVTDDVSTDNTCSILLEECNKYAKNGGIHSILFHKNSQNLGVTKNYEIGFKLSHGELIVAQGGDDIAYPNRVSCIVKHWLESQKKAYVIFHKLRPINMDDTPCGYEWWELTLRNPIGAAMAYHRDVVDKFPTITHPLGFEDGIFGRRAFLLGEELHINEVLLDYRIGSGVTSTGNDRQKRTKISKGMIEAALQNDIDINSFKDTSSLRNQKRVKELIEEIKNTYGYENKMITSSNPIVQISNFLHYSQSENRIMPLSPYGLMVWYTPLLFPQLGKITAPLHGYCSSLRSKLPKFLRIKDSVS